MRAMSALLSLQANAVHATVDSLIDRRADEHGQPVFRRAPTEGEPTQDNFWGNPQRPNSRDQVLAWLCGRCSSDPSASHARFLARRMDNIYPRSSSDRELQASGQSSRTEKTQPVCKPNIKVNGSSGDDTNPCLR